MALSSLTFISRSNVLQAASLFTGIVLILIALTCPSSYLVQFSLFKVTPPLYLLGLGAPFEELDGPSVWFGLFRSCSRTSKEAVIHCTSYNFLFPQYDISSLDAGNLTLATTPARYLTPPNLFPQLFIIMSIICNFCFIVSHTFISYRFSLHSRIYGQRWIVSIDKALGYLSAYTSLAALITTWYYFDKVGRGFNTTIVNKRLQNVMLYARTADGFDLAWFGCTLVGLPVLFTVSHLDFKRTVAHVERPFDNRLLPIVDNRYDLSKELVKNQFTEWREMRRRRRVPGAVFSQPGTGNAPRVIPPGFPTRVRVNRVHPDPAVDDVDDGDENDEGTVEVEVEEPEVVEGTGPDTGKKRAGTGTSGKETGGNKNDEGKVVEGTSSDKGKKRAGTGTSGKETGGNKNDERTVEGTGPDKGKQKAGTGTAVSPDPVETNGKGKPLETSAATSDKGKMPAAPGPVEEENRLKSIWFEAHKEEIKARSELDKVYQEFIDAKAAADDERVKAATEKVKAAEEKVKAAEEMEKAAYTACRELVDLRLSEKRKAEEERRKARQAM